MPAARPDDVRPATRNTRAAPEPSPDDEPADGPGDAPERGQRGIQSVEVGGQLLVALAHEGRALPLKDLARAAAMTPAKAHPYLVSFGKLGLIQQDPMTGWYALGPLALQLGLMALQQHDPVRAAIAELPALAQAIGHTVAVAVMGNRGPTIVHVVEAPSAVHVNMRHGTVFSIHGTASGRLYAALQPSAALRALYEAERRAARPTLPAWPAFEAELGEIRRHDLSRAEDGVVPGVSAMSAPVRDHAGELVVAVTAIGPTASFDLSWAGPVARGLRDTVAAITRRIGGRSEPPAR